MYICKDCAHIHYVPNHTHQNLENLLLFGDENTLDDLWGSDNATETAPESLDSEEDLDYNIF